MKHILFVAALFIALGSNAQALKRLADRAKQKIENKAGDKVDQAVDKTVDGKNTNGNNNANVVNTSNTETVADNSQVSNAQPQSMQN